MEEDLTGQKFGRLTAISLSHIDKYTHRMWLCECDCGKFKIVRANDLKRGKTKSCGCLKGNIKFGTYKHRPRIGLLNKRISSILSGMRQRCYNKNNKSYKNYGGRGISICDEWLYSTITFQDWAYANGYEDSLTIDRIDVNGNYCPENCKWADRRAQANNRTNNRLITYNGETHTLSEWLRILGLLK